jgi:hypothetical protein
LTYFSSFPTITYANVVVTDLTRRVTLPQTVLRQPTAFSPYTVKEGQRQDLVSFLYYGQDDDDWLIGLANQIVDPYYGWFLDDDVFNEFLVDKYGDLPTAMGRIDHWATNWASDTRQVTPAYYDALTDNLRKFWIPVFGQGIQVIGYQRRPTDWTASTNMLQDFTMSANVSFQGSDLVAVYDPGGNQQGTGEVVWASGSNVTVKDVLGTWSNGYSVASSSANSVISSVGEQTPVIPIDEVVYYTPVTCYDLEWDQNEQSKEILLIQDTYRGVMYTELANALVSNPQA